MLMLAGGQENAKAVYFPTNGGGNYDGVAGERALESFEELTGWKDVTLMHTYDPLVADTEEFWAPLEEANLVYFAGGLPYRSYDSYFGTGTQAALDRLLQRGGVFGGSSAGALMQPNVMLRGDSSNNNAIMLGDHVEGFALGEMENVVVDVHYLERNRGYDIIDAIDVYPDHVGFSIDEGTALVMEPGNDEAYVVGTGWVAVYDPTLWQETKFCADFRRMNGNARPLLANNGRYFFLRQRNNGRSDRYNIATREVVQSSDLMDTSMDDYSIEE
jgi:cyanophycinase